MSDEENDLAAAHALLVEGKKPEAFNHLVKARAAAGRDLARLDLIASGMEHADQIQSAFELRNFIAAADPNDLSANLEYLRVGAIASGWDVSAQKTIENQLDALVVRIPKQSGQLWLKTADVYYRMKSTKWLRASKKAIAADGNSIGMLREFAHRYLADGRRWRAWWMLRKLFARADLPQAFLAELSWLSREARCPNLALRYARRLQALEPLNVDALVLEAKAFVAKRRPRRAAGLIKRRLEEFQTLQDNGNLALQASPVLSAGGEYEAERTLLRDAAARWPDNQEVATALQVAQFTTNVSSWSAKA